MACSDASRGQQTAQQDATFCKLRPTSDIGRDQILKRRCAGLSSALFAPGWVWETCPAQVSWSERSERFWELLSAARGVFEPPRATATVLPFKSSFCQGSGCELYEQESKGVQI